MKQEMLVEKIIKVLDNYLLFFLMVAFITTCCMTLFLSTLSSNLDIVFTEDNINLAAKLTFANVIFLSLIFTIIDSIRRKITVDRPVKRISEAAERIIQGDFSVRIESQSKFATDEKFNEIIDCFNKMAQELNSVETLRTDFIANVSHEMKTPLAVMQNYGTLLQTPNLSDEERIEYARGITEGSKRLANMMTNILKLNRLENQQIYPQVVEYDLGEQLCEAILQYEHIWEKENIELQTDLAENVIIKADAELLNLVWNNLLSNAFKFTPTGGTVTISLAADVNSAVVTIKDSGCGMTQEVLEHIFEKFYQGDTSHATQGNGLGLALVKRVIDIVEGDIQVKSLPNQGTSFIITLRRN